MYHQSHYRVDHHPIHNHVFQRCHLKQIFDFESSMMYQKYELFKDFDRGLIGCEEKAKVLSDYMESNDLYE